MRKRTLISILLILGTFTGIYHFRNRYTMYVKSTVSEMHSVYMTCCLSGPENADFSPLLDLSTQEELSFGGLSATTSASKIPANISYQIIEDGDGNNNTLDVVFKITPVIEQGGESAFGPGKTCTVTFDSIIHQGFDQEYAKTVLSEKHAGQTDYVLESDKAARLRPETVLASGSWEFHIELLYADQGAVELLEAPVSATATVLRQGSTEFDIIEKEEAVTATSIQLRPTSMTISFEKPSPTENFHCLYMDKHVVLVMKDGSSIAFIQIDGAKETAFLKAERPIVTTNASYLLFSDDTKIPIVPHQ